MLTGKPALPDGKNDGRQGPRSLLRVLTILRLLAGSDRDLTLTEVSESANWPKSSIMVLMRSLVNIGYLERIDDKYRLGPASYELASRISAGRDLAEIARSPLIKLAKVTGQTALLTEMGPDQQSAVHLSVIQSDRPIRFVTPSGASRPLYTTANGTCLVSFMPLDWINRYLKTTKFTKYTKNTVVNRSVLRARFLENRERGFAVTLGEYSEGVGGVAAPILTRGGTIAAAIGVAGPVEVMKSNLPEFAKLVTEASRALSAGTGRDRR